MLYSMRFLTQPIEIRDDFKIKSLPIEGLQAGKAFQAEELAVQC